jgi:uncharacterized protein (TIGR03067 family)
MACAAAILVVSCSVNARADELADKALEELQGTWVILSFTSGDEDVPAATLQNWRRFVRGNRVTWKDGDMTLLELEIRVDPKLSPKTLDSTVVTQDGSGGTMLAIYELAGDELRVCFKPPGEGRPKEFFTAAGAGQLMYHARRVGP